MVLIPMTKTQIFKCIDQMLDIIEKNSNCIDSFSLNKYYTIQITLIDGKTVLGEIIPKSSHSDNYIILEFTEQFNEHSIFIPLDTIAGINYINYQEDTIDDDIKYINNLSKKSSNYYMLEDLFVYAHKMNLKIKHHICAYNMISSKPFAWGDLSYLSDTALYADWNYLQIVSGGINALGAGIAIFSLSSGWTESLWSQFKKKVKQNSVDICKINTENEAVVKGYISFVKHYSTPHSLESSIDSIEMEGSKWIPAIISTKKIINNSDIKTNSWTLVYLKEDGLMFPLKAWDRISNPINVYCEVVHVTISTEFGTTPFYLKARCAAYIKE